MTESSLSGLVGQRGAQTAIAVRCAERLRPLLHFPDDFPRGEHLEASVDRALAAARDAALGRSIADRNAETRERGRLELLEVARAIEEVEPSDKPRGHFHPAIHALEFMQDRGADQAVLSLGEGMIYALYPDDVGTTWALQRRAQSVARRAVAEDIQWLLDRGRVHPRFFEHELWPSGSLLGWEATLDRHQAWIDEHWAKRKSAREPVSGV